MEDTVTVVGYSGSTEAEVGAGTSGTSNVILNGRLFGEVHNTEKSEKLTYYQYQVGDTCR